VNTKDNDQVCETTSVKPGRPIQTKLAVRVGVTLNGLDRSKAVAGIRTPGARSVSWGSQPGKRTVPLPEPLSHFCPQIGDKFGRELSQASQDVFHGTRRPS
jgi:hypothetical protein